MKRYSQNMDEIPFKRPKLITNYNILYNKRPFVIVPNRQKEIRQKKIDKKNEKTLEKDIIIKQQQDELNLLQQKIERLKLQNDIINKNNSDLYMEMQIQKERAIGFEQMNSELYSQILDLHRTYFIENTPIDRLDCNYLS